MTKLTLEPIGYVQNEVPPGEEVTWENMISQVVIEERFSQALEGMEGFSHVIVIFWLHEAASRLETEDEEPKLKIHPEGREDIPLVGVLATRSPVRPNPIAVTVVRLLKCQRNILTVRGLDAYHGTPVLDVKPYLPNGDSIPEAKVPEWILRLWGKH